MISKRYSTYSLLRREYTNSDEMADTINRSRSYVASRLSGQAYFTARDKKLLLEHINVEVTAENIEKYFA